MGTLSGLDAIKDDVWTLEVKYSRLGIGSVDAFHLKTSYLQTTWSSWKTG
jgi:hypothetical protein